MTTTTKPASQILREARALIDAPEKWVGGGDLSKGAIDGPDTFCAAYACGNRGNSDNDRARTYLETAIGLSPTGMMSRLGAWNDAPERTHAEVMTAFDKAIELAEHEEAGRG